MKRITGIDPSMTGTGIVRMDSWFGDYSFESIRMGSKFEGREIHNRLKRFIPFVKEIVKWALKEDPHLILIEGYSFGSSGQATVSIGELGGMLRYELWRKGYGDVIAEIPPKTLKKFAAQNGNASKEQMEDAVWEWWGEEFESDDEVDAFALAQLGRGFFDHLPSPLPQKSFEVVDDVYGVFHG